MNFPTLIKRIHLVSLHSLYTLIIHLPYRLSDSIHWLYAFNVVILESFDISCEDFLLFNKFPQFFIM